MEINLLLAEEGNNERLPKIFIYGDMTPIPVLDFNAAVEMLEDIGFEVTASNFNLIGDKK